MSLPKAPGSYLDSYRRPMSPGKQTANSSIEKECFSEISNFENNPSTTTKDHHSEMTTSFGYASFQNDQPSFQNDHPSFQHDNPSFQNDQPSFHNDQPSFQNDQPSFHGDTTAMETNGGSVKAEDSDLWKVGATSNVEETLDKEDHSADEMGIMLSEELGNFSTELRDEVMMMKPSLQQQEDQDESMVTKAQLLLRDAVEYRQKLVAIKDQYCARLDQVSSSLSSRSQN